MTGTDKDGKVSGAEAPIRRAEPRDIPGIARLLLEVQAIHAKGRPDLFEQGGRKYTDEEIAAITADEDTPVFVYESADGGLQGYVFCEIIRHGRSMNYVRELYIDDLCVDAAARRKGIGRALVQYAENYAASVGIFRVTLNVWEINPEAGRFYESLGFRPLKTYLEKTIRRSEEIWTTDQKSKVK